MTDEYGLPTLGAARTAVREWVDDLDKIDNMPAEDWIAELIRRRRLVGALTTKDRPPRRIPTLRSIAVANDLGDTAHCVKCEATEEDGWPAASRWLDRAHVIDRCFGGLDVEINLRPLCRRCHRIQPVFRPGQEKEALAWFATSLVEESAKMVQKWNILAGGDSV